jgi:hypothetical protein
MPWRRPGEKGEKKDNGEILPPLVAKSPHYLFSILPEGEVR